WIARFNVSRKDKSKESAEVRVSPVRTGFRAVLVAGVLVAGAIQTAAADTAPFKDPNAVGVIGFCNKNRQLITSGSIYDRPFVATVVSSAPAPQGYEHGRATLYAFQPRVNSEPAFWSGKALGASSIFSNPKHPMSKLTN